jgi:hypothetical protein
MANLPESATYDAGVYQLETTDPVIGGADGKDNASARNLANRTAYLKAHVDLMETIVSQADAEAGVSTTLKGWNALRVHQAILAAIGGYLSKSVAGSADVTLTSTEADNGILNLTGALTNNIDVIVPATPTRSWIVKNSTTGAHTITIRTPAGSGVVCTQGYKSVVWTDGTNVQDAMTDFDNVVLTGSPVAPTPAQFDNDTSIATTAFVKQALGNYGNALAYSASTNLPASAAGQWLYFNADTITLNLPLMASCPDGTAFHFSANAKVSAFVGTQGTDTITAGNTLSLTSVLLGANDTATFVNKSGAWYLLGGETRLRYCDPLAGPTPPQFDNDISLATTAFVKQALGNHGGAIAYAANANIPETVAGQWIYFNANSITLNLPLLASCPDGTALYISSNAKTGSVIGVQGSDVIVAGASLTLTSIALAAHDTAVLINKTGAWYLLSGEARLPYSSTFANSLATNGYLKLPSGLIMQWGAATTSASADVAVTFPIAFPTGCYNLTFGSPNVTGGAFACGNTVTASGFNVNGWNSWSTRIALTAHWKALGK